MNKAVINTYSTIYDVDIVVANKYTTLKQLQKLYRRSDNEELNEDIMDCVSSCSSCYRKSDNKPVELIKWNMDTPSWKVKDKTAYMVNTCAHEATHATIDILQYVGQHIDTNSHEACAYFIGFIAECIYNTVNKKIKKNDKKTSQTNI